MSSFHKQIPRSGVESKLIYMEPQPNISFSPPISTQAPRPCSLGFLYPSFRQTAEQRNKSKLRSRLEGRDAPSK